MSKYKRKVGLALEARRKDFALVTNNDTVLRQAGQFRHKPGSQNRKKGWGAGSKRR